MVKKKVRSKQIDSPAIRMMQHKLFIPLFVLLVLPLIVMLLQSQSHVRSEASELSIQGPLSLTPTLTPIPLP